MLRPNPGSPQDPHSCMLPQKERVTLQSPMKSSMKVCDDSSRRYARDWAIIHQRNAHHSSKYTILYFVRYISLSCCFHEGFVHLFGLHTTCSLVQSFISRLQKPVMCLEQHSNWRKKTQCHSAEPAAPKLLSRFNEGLQAHLCSFH